MNELESKVTNIQHAFDNRFGELHLHARAGTKECILSLVKFGRGYSVNTFCQSHARHKNSHSNLKSFCVAVRASFVGE